MNSGGLVVALLYLVPLAIGVGLWLALTGVADLVGAARRTRDAGAFGRGAVKLTGVAGLIAAWYLSGDEAERRNRWIDRDGNGILDPMANGSYDWVDINGNDFVIVWFFSSAAVLAVVVFTLHALGRREPTEDLRSGRAT